MTYSAFLRYCLVIFTASLEATGAGAFFFLSTKLAGFSSFFLTPAALGGVGFFLDTGAVVWLASGLRMALGLLLVTDFFFGEDFCAALALKGSTG